MVPVSEGVSNACVLVFEAPCCKPLQVTPKILAVVENMGEPVVLRRGPLLSKNFHAVLDVLNQAILSSLKVRRWNRLIT